MTLTHYVVRSQWVTCHMKQCHLTGSVRAQINIAQITELRKKHAGIGPQYWVPYSSVLHASHINDHQPRILANTPANHVDPISSTVGNQESVPESRS